MSFASKDMTAGQLNAIVKRFGGKYPALRFARGEGRVVFDTIITNEAWWRQAGAGYLSPNFRSQFVDREIPTTDAIPLKQEPLGQEMNGTQIVEHLGGREKAVITAIDLAGFMNENRESEGWFVAILEGADSQPWVVRFSWVVVGGVGGWNVYADPVTVPNVWGAGYCYHTLSRK